ncbi:dienelactone hydrolase family protein [Rhizosaccharibacter radicis]|uniref:Dienelactone hydrolase family protein n=1 Tax=Rhizosaccharibacter radicis TaxID=2782605 RepID=A0ABT1VVS9_9PROT|nr:dienelactone hydrolase family protein [Acetobacteraceae bacterium KSS12]
MSHQTGLVAADGHRLSAYRAGFDDAPRALVVLQEIFGVNHHIRSVCDGFAAQGFQVIAPALFDRAERGVELGYDPPDAERGKALRAAIPAEETRLDLLAAADALGREKVGVIGYCWGGSLAWIAATRTDRFAAAIGWYGAMVVDSRDAAPRCPVQLHFGAEDHGIPLRDVELIRQAQPGVDIFVYEGAGHGFGCSERVSYDAAATALAQQRSLALLQHHL